MATGTAPRKINGVWRTRTGRKLSDAGQKFWDNRLLTGEADGKGHYQRGARVEQATPAPKKPHDPRTWMGLPVSDRPPSAQYQRQKATYEKHQQATRQARADVQAATDRRLFGQALPAIRESARQTRLNPAAEQVIKAVSPGTAVLETVKAARERKPVQAGIAALGIVPFGRGPRLVRAGVDAVEAVEQAPKAAGAVRALKVGEHVQQVPSRSQSRLTRAAVDQPADVVSQRFPNAPFAGARSRVMKHAGREQKEEIRRGRVAMESHVQALPKRGSDSDVAHFWWAQLPEDMRNTTGLRSVRDRLASELESVTAAPTKAKGKLRKADQPQRARDLSAAVARLDQVIKNKPVLNPRTIEAVSALSGARKETLQAVNLLDPEKAAGRERLVTRWLTGARYEKPTAGKLGKPSASLIAKRQRVERLQAVYDKAVARASEKAVAYPAEQTRTLVRRVNAEGVANKRRTAIVSTSPSEMPPKGSFTSTVERLGAALSVAKDELASHEAAAAKRVKETGVIGGNAEPGRGEIFIGHRQDTPRGAFGIRSPGTGKPKVPQGVGQENKMELLSSGRVRMSTHVAAEDWSASRTYADNLRARNTLAKIADRLPHPEGEFPEKPIKGYMILNPHGDPVPRGWKTDKLAQLSEGGGSEDLHAAAKEVLQGFIGDERNWSEIVQQAKQAGVADQLRIIPEKDVERYYKQFLPVARAGTGGRVYDKMIDSVATSLIFARLGYIPKNIGQNIIMAVPHQGPRLFMNLPRAGQLIPHPGQTEADAQLWHLLASEVSGGASGSIATEATTRLLGKPAQFVTGVADTPFRISALLNEFANRGVIPKWSTHLSDTDKQHLLHALTSPSERPLLNDAMQTARDAMGDFERMDPKLRRQARRFLIVPGWLAAGTRYPFKFASSYPLRSAALAYAAAGEPGAPDRLKINKPIDEYLAGGLPSFLKGVDTGHGIERTQSLFPASLPADIAFAATQGDPLTAASYANPLPESIVNIARSQTQKLSGETVNVPFTEALTGNLKRLAPGESFVQDLVSPPSGKDRLYPDTSRVGRIKRELGVLPVKVNRDVALRMQFSERGMETSLGVVDRKREMLDKIQAAGEKPSRVLLQVYDLQLERAKRLDGIHAHGLTYQQKAYRSDLGLLVKRGLISSREATDAISHAKTADEESIKKWRRWLTDHKFSGPETDGKNVIEGVRDYLKDRATAGQPAG